jgi:hypothetical protein
VDESSDQRSNGRMRPCKNAPAYRTVVLDTQGKAAMKRLRTFLKSRAAGELVFSSQNGGPLLETTILNQGLYPALKH